MGSRLSKHIVKSCRKRIYVRAASRYGMHKNIASYMRSILSPGISHQRLPSGAAAKPECTYRGRCLRKANRNTDTLHRNGTVGIINRHNTVHTVYCHRIWSCHTVSHIIDPVTVCIKVIAQAIDHTGCILHKAFLRWVNIPNQIL